MLKKRILASSLASVMALSSVSVVAFADETATANYGEVVTRPELKEHLKTYDKLVAGDINNYGSVQALRFQEAYDHAAYVVADADATDADFTAAYQMVKAVYATLQQYTNEQLKELVDELKPIYDGNNILNEEIMDNIYEEDAFLAFKNAYEEAENTVNVDDLMMVTDAYINLDEAAKTLESKRLTPVYKTEYRAVIREYEAMIAQFSKNELWRRGTVTVNPATGTVDEETVKLTDAAFVTWGELQNIVYGASKTAVVKEVKPNAGGDTVASDKLNAAGTDTWIAAIGGTVEKNIYDQSEAFDSYKSASKTTDSTIKNAYDAAKEAIAVFKSWKAVDADSTPKAEAFKTVNKYRTQLVNDFEATLAGSLGSNTTTAGLFWNADTTGSTPDLKPALKYENGKLLGQEDAAKNNCVLRIDSGTGLIQLAKVVGETGYEGAEYDPVDHSNDSPNPRKSYTIKITEGVDYLKYIPVRAANIKTGTVITGDTAGKLTAVEDALTMLEAYTVVANKGTAATDTDKKTAYGAVGAPKDVADLDENKTVTKPSLSLREYTLINRYLTYALQDLYPEQSDPCSHTRAEIKAIIVKAYDLIDKTGSCSIFADANADLADARRDAVEWVRESEKDKLYKDNDNDHGKFTAGALTNKTATEVYHTLSHDGDKNYDKLDDLLKKYPISYGEIVEKIADVNEKVENDVYGETVKKAVDEVAYCLSVLKASEEGNEAFTDERALNGYNRLRSDIDADDIDATEVALVNALAELDKAIKDTSAGETGVKGDVNGDTVVNAKDALAILKEVAESKAFTADEIAIRDYNNDTVVNAKDALAILKAAANG
ncbi:MAG: dockerin type I repeat-containing protein [Oscillospiraceae bacterium]|nr:dockerin type I repeat-containing protein [Oscillospiraceae bacterium]